MASDKPFDLCLVVDDDEDILLAARLLLRQLFGEVVTTTQPDEALALMRTRAPDVILLDANFARGATDGAEGFRWLGRMLEVDPQAVIVLITAHGGVQVAVNAMKQGATDFVTKPWANERLLATVRTAAQLRASRRETGVEKAKVAAIAAPPAGGETPLLGQSPAMSHVLSLIERAAPTDANVLILGENGTGKELVAREIHRRSRRADGVMLSVDLGAVADNLFESELFGHVKGAFTDARSDRVGRMQAADGGTLFLDEVGNLPLHLQPKLLTALEQRKVTPVGANRPVDFNVRIVAATNLAPDRLADEAVFRPDLLFRLNTVEIELPPLRRRREDIPLLLDHFLRFYARKYGKPERALPADLLAELVAYDWPGNVRALRHAAERAVVLADGNAFAAADFPLPRAGGASVRLSAEASPPPPQDLNLERAERQMIERALKKHAYNISAAATELGLTRGSLYRRMEKHGL
ncbi:DNA-binding transcriptional response regulator, NtrC family, contains REC, AAA-type ATPase, and a Fis-type DNA-binding domains [Sphingomonas laterariae]|uniref:DNA-binding transcriptional response regulator, NtrC family, contains REC, AAA-type ATPase, and a Fis-type DNA-binding domains n=1 Tax=Edaphosphingomonas laterariae TaxID=861865 RepID=A0A239GPH1_9SPHN|nr:sigma-54 dependent transcriptional regulator [Sphingomonas laterariae]SNS70785.1 DNA-binding transcriptional response regulator, NtrC family, contains REC, AAA-type ATPase, and a Fis-type DNA-binding domains [Sphingomonas laterariae]